MTRPSYLKLVSTAPSRAAPFVDLAAQAADLAVRLMRRGDVTHALDALAVARTMLDHVQGEGA